MLCHTNLGQWYEMNFSMVQHHKYNMNDLLNLLPYERDLYFGMLINFIEDQNKKAKNQG
jgi:hypothetical protein